MRDRRHSPHMRTQQEQLLSTSGSMVMTRSAYLRVIVQPSQEPLRSLVLANLDTHHLLDTGSVPHFQSRSSDQLL